MNQADVQRATQMSQAMVSRIFVGMHVPDLVQLDLICAAIGSSDQVVLQRARDRLIRPTE